MKLGFRVGTIDLDARQGTFTAFWRNRAAQSEQVQSEHGGRPLEQSKHRAIQRSTAAEPAAAEADEAGRLQDAFDDLARSEEHTSALQSLMRISYAVLCLKKK